MNKASQSINALCDDLREAHRSAIDDSDGFGEIVIRNLLEQARGLELRINEVKLAAELQ